LSAQEGLPLSRIFPLPRYARRVLIFHDTKAHTMHTDRSRFSPTRRAAVVALPALAVLALGGCVVAPVPPPQYGYAASGYEIATVPPPAPRYEVVGVAPYPGAIWINGFWGWNGGRYVWNRGYWHAPRPGYQWVPHRWVPQGGAWHGHGGRWERR
jgi:hypothetical protein